jgi:diazepam-binding inhibitor (GABA receptor modulating acyl-CoA-binding protein)
MSSDLDKEFEKYVELGNNMPPQAADDMLIAYAYFKQATVGDIDKDRPTESSNVVQTFKYDAWRRLEGMPSKEAKKRYIQTIIELQERLKKGEL